MEQTENSMTNIATIGLVRIFLRALDTAKETLNAAGRASMVFEKLIDVSLSSLHPTDARLTALKLLFRIRCDSSGALYVIHATENDFLVSVLTRTSDRTSDIMMSRANSVDDLIKSSQSEEGGVTHSSSNKPLKDPSSLPLSTTATTTTTTTVTTGNRTTFSASHQQTARRWRPPVWTYLEPTGLPEEPPEGISELALAFELPTSSNSDGDGGSDDGGSGSRRRVIVFKLNLWLEAIIMLLQRERDWDIYSYVLAHLGPQLMNRHLMQYSAVPQIKLLRSVLCEQIKNESFLEPFSGTGVKKADVAICIYDSLTMMICFHEHFAKSEQDELVRCFMLGIGSWEGTSRGCIHALSICCHEIPRSVTRMLIAILDKMAKIITQHHNAVHILEFLALLARLPEVFTHLREEEIRPVFGICIRFIQSSREKRLKAAAEERNAAAAAAAAASGSKSSSKDEVPTVTSAAMSSTATSLSISKDLSRYVYILAYHVMIFWFLSLKLQDRVNHVSWITRSLIFTDAHGKDVVEEQSQVLIDMMQRFAS
ncbi:Tuberous sclerosis 2-like protein [Ascosphaera atra]|nr:Tuberous sclerosis 2-like protein [Ascosphaera atra]